MTQKEKAKLVPVSREPALLTERDAVVRAGDCMACGSCVDACPTHALSMGLGKDVKPTETSKPSEKVPPVLSS